MTTTFVSQATHDPDRDTFEERDDVTKVLGPLYNAPLKVTRIQFPAESANRAEAITA
jgi:hypothetical protein